MEVYPRSSWFLLLLGFALIAATLQETTDCPTPDQVSCTSGTKCSEDEDCQETEKCCANACYTKRCTPTAKGVQGEAETDGPSETDCRPYIEKALKELEIGEAGHTRQEPSENDESAEDIPTIEITDDSSHQEEEDGGQGEASEEAEAEEDQKAESTEEGEVQQEAAKGSTEDESGEVSGETPDEKELDKSEEKAESDEDTKAEPSKEESAEENEQAEQASAEDGSKEEDEVQQEAPDTASVESIEEPQVEEAQIVKRDIPAETVQSIPVQETTGSQEDEESTEKNEQQSEEQKDESKEDDGKSAEAPEGDSKEDSEEAAKSKEESAEEKAVSKEEDDEKADDKSDEDKTTASEEAGESKENDKSEEQKTVSAESTEEGGCPDPSHVSCTEGDLCVKHRNCGENQICCPNHCYRKRCVPGFVSEAELEAESISEESQEEAKSEEQPAASSTPETGCPPPSKVSCTEGELCVKHRQCGEDNICCPNKCYRKRCVSGTATSAELKEESEEEEEADSKEENKEKTAQAEAADKTPETGCPSPSEVSCTEGVLCSKHKQCGEDAICCPNKCYRKRCVPGTATEDELAAEESEEESTEEKEEAKSAEDKTVPRTETGCPQPSQVSCTEGQLCSKHKHCGEEKICCPNKCYRRRCVPGTATSAELEAESDEESEEEAVTEVPRKSSDTGCPERDEVSCKGEKCVKNKECDPGEICCANKCYRKVCIPGTPASGEEDEESEEVIEDKSVEAKEESAESQEGDCPSPNKVSCTEGQRCGDDDDCSGSDICCPNKCYNRRCVPGPDRGDEQESSEEEKIVEEAVPKSKVREMKEEVREDVKTKAVPPPPPPPQPQPKKEPAREVPKPEVKQAEVKKPELPKPEAKKPEVKIAEVHKPEIKKAESKVPFRPIKVIETVPEVEEESLEIVGEAPVEDLSLDTDIPTELRPRDHVEHLLKLDKDSSKLENVQNRVYEETLKELKKLYENAIKPLEGLYKYRDLSNRHFGDAEIFSKPLILFMGPWSGGKSSIINYLVNNEYNETSLRTGAEPSPAYFNILTYGDEPDIIDGTELAADFTFSGLQKFGQGLEERLRGIKLPSKLLEKVNIVEIPGILEVRKQVSRVFPFNDACQWFIDRADIIFLVYDPSKLDVGPETEAILDQLKGREHQTRIILNKADQVKPEELMRVQGALIWNISPLMSSPQPPVMYTTSLWSRPYEPWAPVRLLQAQERAFLRDLRTAVDRRVENKIASARRFAVRVRNHAKMVDCYLTTYYNHKSVFGNRKQVANEIIEHPQDYHIYEGLSTLTNISRYDLPDPDVYRDFFKLNPLYEFQQLSATCTYFRGCPINRLDIAIAYDFPELIGTYKRNLEEALSNANNPPKESSPPSQKTKTSAPGS